jgi:hypothetical protein
MILKNRDCCQKISLPFPVMMYSGLFIMSDWPVSLIMLSVLCTQWKSSVLSEGLCQGIYRNTQFWLFPIYNKFWSSCLFWSNFVLPSVTICWMNLGLFYTDVGDSFVLLSVWHSQHLQLLYWISWGSRDLGRAWRILKSFGVLRLLFTLTLLYASTFLIM